MQMLMNVGKAVLQKMEALCQSACVCKNLFCFCWRDGFNLLHKVHLSRGQKGARITPLAKHRLVSVMQYVLRV